MNILKSDCYYTPLWCYKSLLPYIRKSSFNSFYEPCAGDCRINEFIAKEFNPSINNYNEPRSGGYNFINHNYNNTWYDFIMSNPPYSLAEQCVRKSFEISSTVCWLLKLQFLSSQGRKELFKKHPLTTLFVLSKRPSFDGLGTDRYDYAWFVWDNKDIFNTKGIVHL